MKINTKDLRIAEVRYFDTLHNGVLVPSVEAYVLLQKIGDQYVNVFHPEVEYPIYERVPYSNTTMDGWDFGTKIIQVSGECKDGLCYVMARTPIQDVLRVNQITREELEKVILKSNVFFIDRIDLLKKQKNSFFNKQLWDDKKKMKEFQQYIDSCERGLQYHKQNQR